MEKISSTSLDINKQNIDKIKKLFPEAVEEGKINFDMLRVILGDEVDDSREKYQFTWNGKAKSIKLAQTPSSATLRPRKEKSKNWDTTENLYIEGDNLEVLKQLQKTYYGKIKMIYIDPPYNTGNDFVYHDDFKNSLDNYKEQTNQNVSSNPESNGRFHTDWLNMMYPRIMLAKNVLKSNGVMFISINEVEYSNLKKICDEIFGENSFVATLHVELSATQGMKVKAAQQGNIVKNAEYILIYSKDGHKNIAKQLLYDYRPEYDIHYSKYLTKDNDVVDLKDIYNELNPKNTIKSLYEYSTNEVFKKFVSDNAKSIVRYDKTTGFIVADFKKGIVTKVKRAGKEYTLISNGDKVRQLLFLSDSFGPCDDFKKSFGLRKIRGDWWKEFYKDMGNVSKEGNVVFANGKKPVRLILQIIKMCTDKEDIIMDFYSGSATTAHAAMKLNAEDGGNRKFIMIQLPELCNEKSERNNVNYKNICELGEERIRRAGNQIKKEWENEHPSDGLFGEEPFNVDIGFKVFKLDSTNIVPWDSSAEYTEYNLFNMGDVFKANRSKEDILYEIMLKYGVFDKQVTEIEINGKTMYRIGRRYMIVCLENNIDSTDVNAIGELSPKTVVFKESGFIDDNAKINATYNLEKAGVEDIKCI